MDDEKCKEKQQNAKYDRYSISLMTVVLLQIHIAIILGIWNICYLSSIFYLKYVCYLCIVCIKTISKFFLK